VKVTLLIFFSEYDITTSMKASVCTYIMQLFSKPRKKDVAQAEHPFLMAQKLFSRKNVSRQKERRLHS